MNTTAAVALALASVIAYAAGAAVQHRVATHLVPAGAWWWAVALNAVGAALHVAALAFGPLTLVQPIGALTLVLGVPIGERIPGGPTGVTVAAAGAVLAARGIIRLTTAPWPPTPGPVRGARRATPHPARS